MALPKGIHAEIKFSRRMDVVCETENTRYALAAVECRPAGKGEVFATATDTRCLAIARESGEMDSGEPILVPASIVKPLPKKEGNASAKLNGRWERGKTMADRVEGKFPRVSEILPCVGNDYLIVTLTPKLLAKLGQAIGSDELGAVSLIIEQPKPDKNGKTPRTIEGPIPVVGDNGIGLIMPCGIPGSTADSISNAEKLVKRYMNESAAYREACNPKKAAPVVESPPVDDSAFADYTADERKRYDETVSMLAYARLPAPDPADWLARVRSAK